MPKIFYHLFLMTSLSFLAFAYADWQAPGLVSYVFPLWILLLLALVSGAATLWQPYTPRRSSRLIRSSIAMLTGLIFAVCMLRQGEMFADARIFLALAALVLPGLMMYSLHEQSAEKS